MKVELLKYTEGGIELVARSARVSGVPEHLSDGEIVRMIVENDYSSALEHISFSFNLSEISIALSRELLEHRIASHTARSTRYQEEKNFGYYVPAEFAKKPELREKYEEAVKTIARTYKALRGAGATRESARYLLPLAAHTNYIWTINARSLINFLGLRMCVRASPEMRELAEKAYAIAADKYPQIFEGIGRRGKNMAVCPENEVRDSPQGKHCPYKVRGSKAFIPTKRDVKENKELWKETAVGKRA